MSSSASSPLAAWVVGVSWTAVAFRVLFRRHVLRQAERLSDAERV